jgi:hypothetical protein
MKIKNIVKCMMICGVFILSPQSYSAPMQNTIDACSDKDQGDVCSFTNDQGVSVDGSCQYISNDESDLVCQANQ